MFLNENCTKSNWACICDNLSRRVFVEIRQCYRLSNVLLELFESTFLVLSKQCFSPDTTKSMFCKLLQQRSKLPDLGGARYSEVEMGDRVLVQQEKTNKLSTPFNPTPLTVVSKTGNSLVIEADDGAQYSRNTSHVREFLEPESENVRSDPRATEASVVYGGI